MGRGEIFPHVLSSQADETGLGNLWKEWEKMGKSGRCLWTSREEQGQQLSSWDSKLSVFWANSARQEELTQECVRVTPPSGRDVLSVMESRNLHF